MVSTWGNGGCIRKKNLLLLLLLVLILLLLPGLCDKDVWSYVQGQVLGAGIPNLTSDALIAFTKACNIPNAGAGTC